MAHAKRCGKMVRSSTDRGQLAAHDPATLLMRLFGSSAARLVVARLCFAFLLVFGQQQAFAHALEHDFERIHRDAGAPAGDDQFCAKCLAVAHLGHAGVGGTFSFEGQPASPPRVARTLHQAVVRPAASPYRSRAPPRFS